MKPFLSIALFTLTLGALTGRPTHAGDTGWGAYRARGCSNCADSKFQTPRLNQVMPLRHHEDRKRYNAAPCCGETLHDGPYLVKTVVVSRRRLPHYSYDSNGNRSCHRVLTTTYKEIYSDGSCHVWTEQG
jgi:hypothetical protein